MVVSDSMVTALAVAPTSPPAIYAGDRNHDTFVSIDEVQAAVNAFLTDASSCRRVSRWRGASAATRTDACR